MSKRQYFGIKYPFRNDGIEHYYVDANGSELDGVRSKVLHVIFTPKGQVIRNPEFGTDLIKHIFEQNDAPSMAEIKEEISNSLTRWVSNVMLKDISVVKDENDPHSVFVRVDYGVKEGNKTTNDSVVVKI